MSICCHSSWILSGIVDTRLAVIMAAMAAIGYMLTYFVDVVDILLVLVEILSQYIRVQLLSDILFILISISVGISVSISILASTIQI